MEYIFLYFLIDTSLTIGCLVSMLGIFIIVSLSLLADFRITAGRATPDIVCNNIDTIIQLLKY